MDPETLTGTARQFPRPTPTPDPAEAIVEPPAVVAEPSRGRGGSMLAIVLALLALVVAVYPLAVPHLRPWLLARFGSYPVVDFLARRLGPAPSQTEAVDALSAKMAAAVTRLDANEAGVNRAAGRIAAVESGVATLGGRVDGLAPAVPGDTTAAARPESMEAWAVSASARVEALEKDLGGTVGRVSRLESAFDTTQKRLDGLATPGVSPAVADRIDAVERTLASVADRIAKTEAGIGGTAAATTRIDGAEKTLAEVRGRMGTVEGTATATARRLDELAPVIAATTDRLGAVEGKDATLEGRLAPMEGKVAAVEDRVTQVVDGRTSIDRSLRAAQLSLALLQLNAVVQTHKPFAKEVEVARDLAGGNGNVLAQINLITDYSQTGVATATELRDSFVTIVVPKIRSVAGSDRPLTDRVRSWLSSAIAPTGTATTPPDKDPTSDIIASATQKLVEDDIAGAVQHLGQLEGPAATLAARWMAEARARIAIESAADALGGFMLELLGKTGTQQP